MSQVQNQIIEYALTFLICCFLFACGDGKVHVVTGGDDEVSLAGGDYDRIDPHTSLRPEEWEESGLSTPHSSRTSSVWAPRSSLEANRAATKITVESEQDIIIDYGVWWDTNIESAPKEKKKDVYVFLNFRPVGFFMHEYTSGAKNKVEVEEYLGPDEIQRETKKVKKARIRVAQDVETVASILIPNDTVNRRINDLRIVKVEPGEDLEGRLSPQISSWSMRLVDKGKEERGEGYASEGLQTADRVAPGAGIHTLLTGSTRLFMARKSVDGFQFPISENLFKLGAQGEVRVWMGGKRRRRSRVAMALVQDDELTGGTPVAGKVPELPSRSARDVNERYALRAPFSLGTTGSRTRAFLFYSPVGQRMGPGMVKASNPLLPD